MLFVGASTNHAQRGVVSFWNLNNNSHHRATITDGSKSRARLYWKEALFVLWAMAIVGVLLDSFRGIYDPARVMMRQQVAMNITATNHNHLQKLVEPRKVFVDLGANCGNSFLKLLKSKRDALTYDWEAYLWEPSPQMMQFFLNDDFVKTYPQVTIIPKAAGARDETLQLYYNKGQENVSDKSQFKDKGVCDPKSIQNPSGGTSLLKESKAVGTVSVAVPVVDFAKWLKNLGLQQENGDRLLLKIDVEGAELEILDRLLSDEFDDICLAEKINIEWHEGLFPKRSPLHVKHQEFKKSFTVRLQKKCNRKIPVGYWH
ncbi:hypothetical protein ACA910_012267 [Epithemia clementina (nom. ined.)]